MASGTEPEEKVEICCAFRSRDSNVLCQRRWPHEGDHRAEFTWPLDPYDPFTWSEPRAARDSDTVLP